VTRLVAIAVNPQAGRGRFRQHVPRLVKELIRQDCHPFVHVSESASDLRSYVSQIVARHRDTVKSELSIVIVGGDGTWHQALQELAFSGLPTCLVTTGTGDDNARSLGIPRNDPEQIARIVAQGVTQDIDLGRIVTPNHDVRWFSGVLSAGFDSSVNQRANSITSLEGTARYLAALVAELKTFHPSTYRLQLDDLEINTDAMIVAVGNGSSYGGGMRVCPQADPTDGFLDVVVVEEVSKLRLIRSFGSVYRGSHVRFPFVKSFRVKSISIAAEGPIVFADGEYVCELPVEIDVVSAALTLLVPPMHA
jgi:diacylglycerol kinase (ATP)